MEISSFYENLMRDKKIDSPFTVVKETQEGVVIEYCHKLPCKQQVKASVIIRKVKDEYRAYGTLFKEIAPEMKLDEIKSKVTQGEMLKEDEIGYYVSVSNVAHPWTEINLAFIAQKALCATLYPLVKIEVKKDKVQTLLMEIQKEKNTKKRKKKEHSLNT